MGSNPTLGTISGYRIMAITSAFQADDLGSIPSSRSKGEKMNRLLKAALSHYEAQRDEAIAILFVYFNQSVGIGEHSKLLSEITAWTEKLTEAEENLATLKKHFME